MGAARIYRCRPGGTHGYDPVPATIPLQARWYMPWRYGDWRTIPASHHHLGETQ
jgi:uncharacterized protein